jgi:hypothetical protein
VQVDCFLSPCLGQVSASRSRLNGVRVRPHQCRSPSNNESIHQMPLSLDRSLDRLPSHRVESDSSPIPSQSELLQRGWSVPCEVRRQRAELTFSAVQSSVRRGHGDRRDSIAVGCNTNGAVQGPSGHICVRPDGRKGRAGQRRQTVFARSAPARAATGWRVTFLAGAAFRLRGLTVIGRGREKRNGK